MPPVADVIEFPDMASVIVAFLNAELAAAGETARAATKVPNPRPPKWVRVEVAGGSERNRKTADVLVIIQGSAANEPAAERLCSKARALVRSMPERDFISGASVMACTGSSIPVPFPDPDITTPRYQATVQLAVCP